jgi:hypothetical protein
MHALGRLIRRYESGVCTEAQLTGRLHEVLNELQALMVEWRPRLRGLRHRPSAAMRDCDDAISAAQRLCGGSQFKPCLLQLKRARHGLARLQELIDAYDDYDRAAEAYRGLTGLLDSQQLCQLLTVETIARLLAESEKLLASGRSRQAVFIARMCRHKALALAEGADAGRENVQEVSAKIEQQAEFFRQTEAFAPSSADLKLRRAFERLPDLLARHRVTLVARLVTDIEGELASRRAVWASLRCPASLRQQPGGAAHPLTEDLKRIVRDESWEQAANYLLQQTLAALSAEATALRPDIGHITQQMEATRSDGSRSQAEAASEVN